MSLSWGGLFAVPRSLLFCSPTTHEIGGKSDRDLWPSWCFKILLNVGLKTHGSLCFAGDDGDGKGDGDCVTCQSNLLPESSLLTRLKTSFKGFH